MALCPILTDREKKILKLVADGLADKQIAVQLAIASGTVKLHLFNIRNRLGATNRTHAVVLAFKSGQLELS